MYGKTKTAFLLISMSSLVMSYQDLATLGNNPTTSTTTAPQPILALQCRTCKSSDPACVGCSTQRTASNTIFKRARCGNVNGTFEMTVELCRDVLQSKMGTYPKDCSIECGKIYGTKPPAITASTKFKTRSFRGLLGSSPIGSIDVPSRSKKDINGKEESVDETLISQQKIFIAHIDNTTLALLITIVIGVFIIAALVFWIICCKTRSRTLYTEPVSKMEINTLDYLKV